MAEQVSSAPLERVHTIVEEVIGRGALYLVDVDLRGRSGSQVIDVYVDSDEALDVETLARVSREVEFLLDAEEVIRGRYTLNVSSPGVDRPLKLPRQFAKNVGRNLQVAYKMEDDEAVHTVKGTLVGADDDAISVATSKNESRRIPYGDIVLANVQLPW